MAKKHSNGYIRQVTNRDKKLLVQLAKTGMATVQQAEKYTNVKLKRLKRLERSKYINLKIVLNNGKQTTIVSLNKKGKSYLKQTLMYNQKLAYYNSEHVNHDLQLTETYYKLKPEYQDKFVCEHELISKIYREKPKLTNNLETCLDGAIITPTGEIVGIEVIGKTYKQADITAKINVARSHLNCNHIKWINNTGKSFVY